MEEVKITGDKARVKFESAEGNFTFCFKNYWKIITIKDTNNYFGFTDIKLHRLYFIEETILYLSKKANICLEFKKSLFSLSTVVQF